MSTIQRSADWRMAMTIARWEFRRYFKLKDVVLSLLLMGVMGYVVSNVGTWVRGVAGTPAKVTNLCGEPCRVETQPGSGFELLPAAGRGEAELRAALERKEIAAVLIAREAGRIELLVLREPLWLPKLDELLSARRRMERLAELRVEPAALQRALEPVQVELSYLDVQRQREQTAAKWLAGAFAALMLMGVLLGNANLFTGITGEKQLRVTEQVLAAVSAQTWIDGKILGLSASTLLTLLLYGLAFGLVTLVPGLVNDQPVLPPGLLQPLLGLLLLLALLGLFLWLAFFAAVAATIDDPNTSARSGLLLLPLLPLGAAFAGLWNPDSVPMRVLGILPISSPTVLPARLVLTEVPAWEVVLALGLLVLSIAVLRRAAGKIFGVGMLTHGQEPSFGELWRRAREV